MSQSKMIKMDEITQKKHEMNDIKCEVTPSDEFDFCTIEHNLILPPVMLSNIFLFLDKKDRLNCKVVCKQWLSVMMTDVYFKNDRHLHLNHCVLEESRPPLSIFANAAYGYNLLTIGSDVVLGNDNWEYFGDNIIYLDLAPKSLIMSAKYVQMLTSMPFIRILRVHNDGPIHAGLFGRAMEQLAEQNIKLKLEELRVECVNCNPIKYEYFDVFRKIIDVSPHLKKIHIESIRGRMIPELRKFMEDYPNVKISINLVCHKECPSTEGVVSNVDGMILEHLTYSDERSPPGTLDKYLEKYSTVKSIDLSCQDWPSDAVQNKVTKLDFSLRVNNNYTNTENFPVLKDLTFSSIYSCVDIHSPICHLKVTKLTIKTAGLKCEKCLKAMMLSFPNIVELTIEYNCIKKDTLAMVLQLLSLYKNLKNFALNGHDIRFKTLKSAFEFLPEFYTLPIVDLTMDIEQLNEAVARIFSQKFVHVKYLTLSMENMESGFASVIRIILTDMTCLKHVQFKFCNFGQLDDPQELDAIQEAFVDCGQNLKTIALPSIMLEKEKLEVLFQKMPELHCVSQKQMVVTRVENGQIHVKKCEEKPKRRLSCDDSPPPNRRNDDDHNFDQHRRFFMEEIQNRRRDAFRMHLQRIEIHPNADGQNAANRQNRIRRQNQRRQRFLQMRRNMEH